MWFRTTSNAEALQATAVQGVSWGQQTYTQGTWTTDFQSASEDLNASLNDKVYFAGETYNVHGINPVQGFYIIRGSVQSAILSGCEVVDSILE